MEVMILSTMPIRTKERTLYLGNFVSSFIGFTKSPLIKMNSGIWNA